MLAAELQQNMCCIIPMGESAQSYVESTTVLSDCIIPMGKSAQSYVESITVLSDYDDVQIVLAFLKVWISQRP